MKHAAFYSCLLIAHLLLLASCTTARLAPVHGKGIELDSKKFADLGIVPKGVTADVDGYTIDIATLLREETAEKPSDDMKDIADGTSINVADLLEDMGIHEDKAQGVKIACDNVWLIQLKEWADSWLGVPYLYGGTTRKGIDCSGFSGTLYKNVFDVVLQRNSRAQYSQDCYQTVKLQNLQLGDLVFFVTNGKAAKSANISHVGVYVGDMIFVHASTSKGVVYSRLTDAYWTKTFLTGGRVLKFN